MYAEALAVGSACTIAYQDARTRSFHAGALVTLGLGLYGWALPEFTAVLANLAYVAAVHTLLYGVLCYRARRRVSLTARYLGLGDILLLATLGIGLSTHDLNLVLLVSCAIGLLIGGVLRRKTPRDSRITVPFATALLAGAGLVAASNVLLA